MVVMVQTKEPIDSFTKQPAQRLYICGIHYAFIILHIEKSDVQWNISYTDMIERKQNPQQLLWVLCIGTTSHNQTYPSHRL
jgi:hypothetical protein